MASSYAVKKTSMMLISDSGGSLRVKSELTLERIARCTESPTCDGTLLSDEAAAMTTLHHSARNKQVLIYVACSIGKAERIAFLLRL